MLKTKDTMQNIFDSIFIFCKLFEINFIKVSKVIKQTYS